MMSQSSSFDVVVVGGGPAGLVAAAQAARAGARTLLVEKSSVLGGTTVLNGVNFPGLFHAWGRQIIAGIGWELVRSAVAEAGESLPDFSDFRGRPHWRQQVLVDRAIYAALADRVVIESGCELRLHTLVAEVTSHADGWSLRLCGKDGLAPVRTRVLIDATGDANVVALAGLPLRRNARLQPGTLIMHAAGYDYDRLDLEAIEAAFVEAVERGEMRRADFHSAHQPVSVFLRSRGNNAMHVTDIDGGTSAGKTAAELAARAALLRIHRFLRRQPGLESFRLDQVATECGIRESATIVGRACITADDYASGRLWPDAVSYSFYPIDVHSPDGVGIDIRPLTEGVVPTIPRRAMLPRDAHNLIVAGRSVCGDQEANSAYRVQASAMGMGQAAGALAALAAASGCEAEDVPLPALHDLLRTHGAIVPAETAAAAG